MRMTKVSRVMPALLTNTSTVPQCDTDSFTSLNRAARLSHHHPWNSLPCEGCNMHSPLMPAQQPQTVCLTVSFAKYFQAGVYIQVSRPYAWCLCHQAHDASVIRQPRLKQLTAMRLKLDMANARADSQCLADLSTSAGLEMSAPIVMASPPDSSIMCATSSAGPAEDE